MEATVQELECDIKKSMESRRVCCLFGMENWFHSGWSEDPALAQCQTGLNTDNSNTAAFLVPDLINPPCGFPTTSWLEPFDEEERGANPSKNHSQAEKRRRDRINAHLSSLRKLVPKSDKMDKATLLGRVVEQVKELKRETVELSKVLTLPTDTDQVIIDSVSGCDSNNQTKDNLFIKASICCDDRPELVSELKNALKSLNLTTVQAHMSFLGGRIQGIFILCNEDKQDGVEMDRTKQSLGVMLNRIASSSTTSNYRIKSKRQRFFFPSHHRQ